MRKKDEKRGNQGSGSASGRLLLSNRNAGPESPLLQRMLRFTSTPMLVTQHASSYPQIAKPSLDGILRDRRVDPNSVSRTFAV